MKYLILGAVLVLAGCEESNGKYQEAYDDCMVNSFQDKTPTVRNQVCKEYGKLKMYGWQ